MILRNLSKALKEQNWTAILIEFFLLVAGVYLGIQAANWNEQQRARASAQLIVKNLHADYAAIILQGKENESRIRSARKDIDEALGVLRGPKIAVDGAVLGRGLERMFYIPGALQESATQQELIFSGRMGLVEDDALRALLVRNSAQLTLARSGQQARREFVRPFTAPVMRLRVLLREGYPVQQAIDLAGGKPDLQVGLHAAALIFDGEAQALGQSLESLHLVQAALDRQRTQGLKP